MLVKKYLTQIPLCEIDKRIDRCKGKVGQVEFVYTKIVKSEKYGDIFVADFFTENEYLSKRFFTDGNHWITLEKKDGKWHKRELNDRYSYKESDDSAKKSKLFFSKCKPHYCDYYSSSEQHINKFVKSVRSRQNAKYAEKREELKRNHLSMFPELPANIESYCNQYVFKEKYIILQNLNKKKQRDCYCLSCKQHYSTSENIKHKLTAKCPKCGASATAIAERYISSVRNKAKMLIMFNVDGNTLKKWMNVERYYSVDMTEKYFFAPYYYEITTERCTYIYHWVSCWWTADYVRTPYPCEDHAHIYADNIKEIYENGWHMNLNLDKLRYAGAMKLEKLFKETKETQTAWQLYKIGLYHLAENASRFPAGNTFEEVLGLSKNYLPALKQWNISVLALKTIHLSDRFLNTETVGMVSKLLDNVGQTETIRKIQELLKQMSFIKMVNYFSKQVVITRKKDFSLLATYYLDYISMAKELNNRLSKTKKFDMTTMNFRFPPNIVKAHDNISNQLTIKNNKKKSRELKNMSNRLSVTHSFSYGELSLVIPQSVDDFIREGNSLSHCVGRGSTYIDNHLKGTWLTFFIRKNENINKPYYTFTIYADSNTVKECHGKCHASPTTQVEEFTKRFLEHISAVKTEIKSDVA